MNGLTSLKKVRGGLDAIERELRAFSIIKAKKVNVHSLYLNFRFNYEYYKEEFENPEITGRPLGEKALTEEEYYFLYEVLL